MPEVETNTDLSHIFNNLNISNLKDKKKPYDIEINNKSKQPLVQPNTKYSSKHNYRRYKTDTEPKLLSKILVNEDDDMINKIRQAFGVKTDDKKTNYVDVETGGAGSVITNVEEPPTLSTRFGSSEPKLGSLNYIYSKINQFKEQDIRKILDEVDTFKTEQDNAEIERLFANKEKELGREVNDKEQVQIAKQFLRYLAKKRFTEERNKPNEKLQEIDDVSQKDQEELLGQVEGGYIERMGRTFYTPNLKEETALLLAEKPDPHDSIVFDSDEEFDTSTPKSTPPLTPEQFREKISAKRIQQFVRSREQRILNESISDLHNISDLQSRASTSAPDQSLFQVLNMPKKGRPRTAENQRLVFAEALREQKKINKNKPAFQLPPIGFNPNVSPDSIYGEYSFYDYAPKHLKGKK
jgi:hypothetical protein